MIVPFEHLKLNNHLKISKFRINSTGNNICAVYHFLLRSIRHLQNDPSSALAKEQMAQKQFQFIKKENSSLHFLLNFILMRAKVVSFWSREMIYLRLHHRPVFRNVTSSKIEQITRNFNSIILSHSRSTRNVRTIWAKSDMTDGLKA